MASVNCSLTITKTGPFLFRYNEHKTMYKRIIDIVLFLLLMARICLEIIPSKHSGSIHFKITTPCHPFCNSTGPYNLLLSKIEFYKVPILSQVAHQHREVMWSKDYTTLCPFTEKEKKMCPTCSLS